MNRYCVVVANGARARVFALVTETRAEGDARYLAERSDVVNPEQEVRQNELFSNLQGSHPSPKTGARHEYDDHRDQHQDEIERRYVREVAGRVSELVVRDGMGHVVVAAPPRALGFFRSELESKLGSAKLATLDKDLSKLDATKIHDHLAEAGLLPKPLRPRPR